MTSTTARVERDGSVRPILVSIAVAGAILAGGALALYDSRTAFGVAAGASIALANIALIGFTVRALTGEDARSLPWAFIGVFKMVALFGGMYLLATAGVVDLLPLAAGYGCLPVGIFASQLRPPPAAREER